MIKKIVYSSIVATFMLAGCGGSDSDTTPTATPTVTPTPTEAPAINTAPTVNAGKDITVTVNKPVTLVGTASDKEGSISSYEWKRGNEVLGTMAKLTYTPTKVGKETLTLRVTDEDGLTSSDKVIVTVKEKNTTQPTNKAPIVNAGEDKTVTVNSSVTITGIAVDSDGTIATVEWKKGNEVLATTLSFSYTPTKVGTDVLTLVVVDEDGESASDSVNVVVEKATNTDSDEI